MFFQAEDGIRDTSVTGVQTCALPICMKVLDEGVDIPQTTTAYLMASSTVVREWVQRRGRILRSEERRVGKEATCRAAADVEDDNCVDVRRLAEVADEARRIVDQRAVGAECYVFSSRRRHTRYIGDGSSDVCSSDLHEGARRRGGHSADDDRLPDGFKYRRPRVGATSRPHP